MASSVTDTDEDEAVMLLCQLKGVRRPHLPCDRVVHMSTDVGASTFTQLINQLQARLPALRLPLLYMDLRIHRGIEMLEAVGQSDEAFRNLGASQLMRELMVGFAPGVVVDSLCDDNGKESFGMTDAVYM
jgi:hypothetical protein